IGSVDRDHRAGRDCGDGGRVVRHTADGGAAQNGRELRARGAAAVHSGVNILIEAVRVDEQVIQGRQRSGRIYVDQLEDVAVAGVAHHAIGGAIDSGLDDDAAVGVGRSAMDVQTGESGRRGEAAVVDVVEDGASG